MSMPPFLYISLVVVQLQFHIIQNIYTVQFAEHHVMFYAFIKKMLCFGLWTNVVLNVLS